MMDLFGFWDAHAVGGPLVLPSMFAQHRIGRHWRGIGHYHF